MPEKAVPVAVNTALRVFDNGVIHWLCQNKYGFFKRFYGAVRELAVLWDGKLLDAVEPTRRWTQAAASGLQSTDQEMSRDLLSAPEKREIGFWCTAPVGPV